MEARPHYGCRFTDDDDDDVMMMMMLTMTTTTTTNYEAPLYATCSTLLTLHPSQV
jgi:hypothetical protein